MPKDAVTRVRVFSSEIDGQSVYHWQGLAEDGRQVAGSGSARLGHRGTKAELVKLLRKEYAGASFEGA